MRSRRETRPFRHEIKILRCPSADQGVQLGLATVTMRRSRAEYGNEVDGATNADSNSRCSNRLVERLFSKRLRKFICLGLHSSDNRPHAAPPFDLTATAGAHSPSVDPSFIRLLCLSAILPRPDPTIITSIASLRYHDQSRRIDATQNGGACSQIRTFLRDGGSKAAL